MFTSKSITNVPRCLTCAHYAFWDDDDVCMKTIKILIDLDNRNCKLYKKRRIDKLTQIHIDVYEKRKDKTTL